MYLNGYSVKSRYVSDPANSGIVKPYSVGLTVNTIALVRGGVIDKKGSNNVYYKPLGVRVDTASNKKYYDIGPGAFQIGFEQGLNSLPKDAVCTIEGNAHCKMVGGFLSTERFIDSRGIGNITSTLVLPEGCSLSIEVGSYLADLYIEFEKFEEV